MRSVRLNRATLWKQEAKVQRRARPRLGGGCAMPARRGETGLERLETGARAPERPILRSLDVAGAASHTCGVGTAASAGDASSPPASPTGVQAGGRPFPPG